MTGHAPGRTKKILGAIAGSVIVFVLSLILLDGGQTEAQQASVSTFQAPVDVDTAGLKGPVQPIFFRHDIHAGQYQIDCRYCHYTVEVSQSPGLPAVSACMGCHLVAGSGNPEVQKLRDTFMDGKTIEWVNVHVLPQFVHFPHMRHIKAGLECQECHGQVQEMPRVYQFGSLKMGWCLDCHIKNEVTRDCTACHY